MALLNFALFFRRSCRIVNSLIVALLRKYLFGTHGWNLYPKSVLVVQCPVLPSRTRSRCHLRPRPHIKYHSRVPSIFYSLSDISSPLCMWTRSPIFNSANGFLSLIFQIASTTSSLLWLSLALCSSLPKMKQPFTPRSHADFKQYVFRLPFWFPFGLSRVWMVCGTGGSLLASPPNLLRNE